jgi:GT2 family glycosyltransferase
MNLSIITVNYRSWGHLEAALAALKPDFPADWEIIIVDNESQAETLEKFAADYPWAVFVANPHNSGFGYACNMGVENATGTQLLFMNPDVIASCDEIRSLIKEKVDNPNVAILAPAQVDKNGRPQKVFDDFPSLLNQSKTVKALLRFILPSSFPDPRARYDKLTYCDWVTGSVLLIDRADFDAIGGWSEDYWMYVEDADLCRRAHELGMLTAFTPDVQVTHAHGGSSRLNVDVKSMTKLEVIISKHVYAANHTAGLQRWLMHALIVLLRLPMLIVAAILDLVTFGRVPTLRVRSKMLTGLLRYYSGVMDTGEWLSPRALANRTEAQ